MVAAVDRQIDELAFSRALQSIWDLISACNKYIDDTAPWALAKDPASRERLATVMYCLLESQRIIHCLLSAFLPSTASKALASLGWKEIPDKSGLAWGGLQEGTAITKVEALFPRMDA